jgi:hypothetical protein
MSWKRKEKCFNNLNSHKSNITSKHLNDKEKWGLSENFGPFIYLRISFSSPLELYVNYPNSLHLKSKNIGFPYKLLKAYLKSLATYNR